MKQIHKEILRKIADYLGDHAELRFSQALYALDIIQFGYIPNDEEILRRIDLKAHEELEKRDVDLWDDEWDDSQEDASPIQLESGWKEKPLQIFLDKCPSPNTKLVFNAIQCKQCHELIVSRDRHDFKWCKCGKVAIDGGLDYISLTGNREDYSDLSLTNRDAFHIVRKFAEWGTHGKLGDQPLTYIKLKDMSDNHLTNLLQHLDSKSEEHFFKELILKEQKYRKENKIEVKDAE